MKKIISKVIYSLLICLLLGAPLRSVQGNTSSLIQESDSLAGSMDIKAFAMPTAISAGDYHNCMLTSAGEVKCWGYNLHGELGDGTKISRSTPVDVVGLTDGVVAVSGGEYYTCALTSAGGVKCWGRNYFGRLGNGSTADSLTPVDVVGLTSGVIAIQAGYGHTCALTEIGGVKCWGWNSNGQLGDGTTTDRLTPVDVSGLTTGVLAISVGDYHTCAIVDTGEVKCWGYNVSGQLGDGTTSNRSTPMNVSGLTSEVTAITASYMHTCALTSDGRVKCWGKNDYGQLGNGTNTNSSTPVDVDGLTNETIGINAGFGHTCALTASGVVSCWGYNSEGQLGDGTNTNRSTPVDVVGLSSEVITVSAGSGHTCALTSTGGVKCWGDNDYGKLGDGLITDRLTPVDVLGLTSGMNNVSSGNYHSCALTTEGGIKCWGENAFGQLGDGTVTSHSTPVEVGELMSGVIAVSAGQDHTCALTEASRVKCWGSNEYGQLGDGTTDNRLTPVDVVGITEEVTAISAGAYHTCMLTSAGGVKCWGYNYAGQIGDATNTDRNTPVDVMGLASGVKEVSAGSGHTCVITSAGGVKCWGGNNAGQLGDGTNIYRNTPIDVIGLSSGIAAVSTAFIYTCAITDEGGVKCWGSNMYGQLGDGTTTGKSTPVDVIGLPGGVKAVDGGNGHTCALTSDGETMCWGLNNSGQLGNGAMTYRNLTPINVSDLTNNVTMISTGFQHSCALTSEGGVKCWGDNNHGQVGWRTIWVPVDVLWVKVYMPVIVR